VPALDQLLFHQITSFLSSLFSTPKVHWAGVKTHKLPLRSWV
jgi:hypothetical protein